MLFYTWNSILINDHKYFMIKLLYYRIKEAHRLAFLTALN